MPYLKMLTMKSHWSMDGDRLGTSMSGMRSLELELAGFRRGLSEEWSEVDGLREAVTDSVRVATLAEPIRRESRENLEAEMARLLLEWREEAGAREAAFGDVYPSSSMLAICETSVGDQREAASLCGTLPM
jgi:hypothetical protein